MAEKARRGCPGHRRHWFAAYRMVGSSLPACVRCGAPNPSYDPQRDPRPSSTPAEQESGHA